jgi:hypothetical protein
MFEKEVKVFLVLLGHCKTMLEGAGYSVLDPALSLKVHEIYER